MAGSCGYDPLARLCGRASEYEKYVWLDKQRRPDCQRPCPCRPGGECGGCRPPFGGDCRPPINGGACRQMPFWPCWNSGELIEAHRPQPRCKRCGCGDRLERQGRFVRCCACGWIGIFEECCAVCCSLRSCCDNLVWPCRPGEPR